MSRMHPTKALCVRIGLLLIALIAFQANAQEFPTESKGQELSAFGGFSVVKTDFATKADTGGTLGFAFTRFFSKLPVEPSLALRGTYASGAALNERSVGIGLQVSRRFRRFHPYADFFVGAGSLVFAVDPDPGEHVDKGLVFTYGGGLDYDLVHNFRLRADAQGQHWDLGINPSLKPDGQDFTITPFLFTIGVNYIIPFHPRVSYRDTH